MTESADARPDTCGVGESRHLLFLDANVLFSAAYRANARVRRLWKMQELPHAPALLCSPYAEAEARRNLEPGTWGRLNALIATIELVPDVLQGDLPDDVSLPEKDRPILLTALAAGATHLLTGDWKHFGPYFGDTAGLRIESPGEYLAREFVRR